MKNPTNRKIFFILLLACLISSVFILPYVLTLMQGVGLVITPALIIGQIIQTIILFSFATIIGLRLANKVGFGLPIIESFLKKEKLVNMKSWWRLSISFGVIASALIILLSWPFGSLSTTFLKAEMAVATWKSFLASFYGGIAEEVLLRLFLMTLLVWITFKIKKTTDGKPTVIGIWLAIILSSVIFGLGHLPITGGLTAITPIVVIRAIVLNGVAGVMFGWLYWKKGLESAMLSHFTADICLHVLTPLIASFFI